MITPRFLDALLARLAPLPALKSRRMFGGVGLYSGSKFFAIVWQDALYLKAAEADRAKLIARGATPFEPFPQRKRRAGTMSAYLRVPDAVIASEELVALARRAAR